MAKWLKVAGLAVVALLVAVSASGDSNTYNYQGSGPYFNTKNGASVDASGNAKVVDADRPEDRSPLTNLLATTMLGNTVVTSNVIDAAQYTSFQVHVSWTVSTADTANADSVALLLIPYSRTTHLDSGDNFIITQARVLGALSAGSATYTITDSSLIQYSRTLPGILVTSRNSIYGRSVTWSGQVMRPERVVYTDFGAGAGSLFGKLYNNLYLLEKNYLFTKKVSFPLGGAAYGGDVKELFLGFYVLNLSDLTASDVTIDIVPKVN